MVLRSPILHHAICFLLAGLFLIGGYSNANGSDDPMFELVVVKGDKLINICRQYLENPRQWREIAKLNLLKNPDMIFPGQRLSIPVMMLHGIPLPAEVTFQKGDVRIQKEEGGAWVPLLMGDKVAQGNRLKTGEESAAELTFEDGTTFFVKPNTLLGITKSQKKGLSFITQDLYMSLGKMITRIRGATGVDSRFKIRTPSAVASARGTEFRVSVDSGLATRYEVLKGTIAVEAMNQRVEVQENEGILIKQGQPPLTPQKLLPPPAPLSLLPLYKSIPLRLRFEKIKDATLFRVMLSVDLEGKEIFVEKTIHTDETLEIPNLPDGMYYLVTQSIDEMGLEGPLSEPFRIKVRINPQPPFIHSPMEGSEFRERSIKLSWLKVEDAARYHIQVAEESEFTTIREERDDVKEESYKTGDLDFKTYYFRVRSIALDGYAGDWSPVVRFVLLAPPESPSLEKPEADSKTIQLRWRPIEGIMSYHFQMARDRRFEEFLVDERVGQPSVLVPTPKVPGLYYVRTSSIDSKGYEGAFSAPQSFEVKPPSPPDLQKPELIKGVIRFWWKSPEEGMSYHVQIAGDKEYKTILVDRNTNELSIEMKWVDKPGIYYIRVSSINTEGYEGEFSGTQSLEIKRRLPYEVFGAGMGVLITLGLILLLGH